MDDGEEEERKFIEEYIDIDELDVFRSTRGKIKVSPILNLMSYYDSKNKKTVGNRVVPVGDESDITDSVAGQPLTRTIPAGETWRVTGARLEADMDGGVADRVLSFTATPPALLATALAALVISGPTLSADQNGSINMHNGPSTWLNDNGAVTRQADTNPLPRTFPEGTIFSGALSLIEVGDLMSLELFFTKV